VGTFTTNVFDCAILDLLQGLGDKHGTAVAEAIIDIAPAVQLVIANPQSPLDLVATVDWMASLGVKVINYSVATGFQGPGNGVALVNGDALSAVNRAVANDILWISAAGNFARQNWRGSWRDTNANSFLDFQTGSDVNPVQLTANQPVTLELRWDDTWGNPATDLDLLLFDQGANTIVASSTDEQGPASPFPYERLTFTPPTTSKYWPAVGYYAGKFPKWVQLRVFTNGVALESPTPAYSIVTPAESRNAGLLAVGAVPWYNTSQIEPFSSRGPTNDGRTKPDLVGADRGSSATYAGPFPGTSQAAPHVAGVAALLRQVFPGSSAVQIANGMRATAQPRGSSSPNNTFGYGFSRLPDLTGDPGGGDDCTQDATTLCLNSERFEVKASWRDFSGNTGSGRGVRLTSDTGYFWIFDSSNVEIVLKVLDACSFNSRFWVFAGGLTNIEVSLEITDTVTGQSKLYFNPLGAKFQPIVDTDAFSGCGSALNRRGAETTSPTSEAAEAAAPLRLVKNRFEVDVQWQTQSDAGLATPVVLTDNTGYFWFFDNTNVEAVVKILDACAVNQRYWVFAAGLTDLGVNLTVRDLARNRTRSYSSTRGTPFQPILDTDAFATCP
jgi:subtilisin family serine protease